MYKKIPVKGIIIFIYKCCTPSID